MVHPASFHFLGVTFKCPLGGPSESQQVDIPEGDGKLPYVNTNRTMDIWLGSSRNVTNLKWSNYMK